MHFILFILKKRLLGYKGKLAIRTLETSQKLTRWLPFPSRLAGRTLTWMTPSIMLTILLTTAMALCVRSAGLMSGLCWLDNTYRHAMYSTYVGDNLK